MIDLVKLKKDVIEIATDNPQTVYLPWKDGYCSYYCGEGTDIGSTGCLIGQALRRQPEVFEKVKQHEESNKEFTISLFDMCISNILFVLFGIPEIDSEWFEKVQNRQDREWTWIDCITEQDEE